EASQQVFVPIGWGVFVFGGGVVFSLFASLVTRALEPEPLRLKSSRATKQARDVREVLREQQQDILRPSAPNLAPPANLRPLYEQQPQPPLLSPQAAMVPPRAAAPGMMPPHAPAMAPPHAPP